LSSSKASLGPRPLSRSCCCSEKPLLALLYNLTELRFKGVELSFTTKLQDLEARAGQLLEGQRPSTKRVEVPEWSPEPPPVELQERRWIEQLVLEEPPRESDFAQRVQYLAQVSPRAAILAAWSELELALHAAARRAGRPEPGSFPQILDVLERQGLFSRETLEVLRDLRTLRNDVAHGRDIDVTFSQAMEYGQLAERLLAALSP
jgi:uncharacterized protein YutE (UPF0331/DUF86 family)